MFNNYKYTEFPDLTNLTNLLELDLSHNQFTKLPALPNSISRLSICYNYLSKLPDFSTFKYLTDVDISYNR